VDSTFDRVGGTQLPMAMATPSPLEHAINFLLAA
jgi:hypothetical protein